MPIFEYLCGKCDHSFELLMQGRKKPVCPACQSSKLKKKISVFSASVSVKSISTSDFKSACGSCGDPRGPGACQSN